MSVGQNTEFSYVGSTQYHPLGFRVTGADGCTYRFCYNAGAQTLAAGDWVCFFSTTPARGHVSGTTTTQMNNGTAGTGAGLAISSVATGKYHWLLTEGTPNVATTTTGNSAKGVQLVINGGTSPDRTVDAFADGEEECVVGVALADDSSTTQAAGTYVVSCERNW